MGEGIAVHQKQRRTPAAMAQHNLGTASLCLRALKALEQIRDPPVSFPTSAAGMAAIALWRRWLRRVKTRQDEVRIA
jgi:hypothetical protein